MKKKTRSILEELSVMPMHHQQPENVVESRAGHIIDSAINLVLFIRENFDQSTAQDLEKRFNNAIRSLDPSKFERGVSKIKERNDLKNNLLLKQGDLREEDD